LAQDLLAQAEQYTPDISGVESQGFVPYLS